MTKTRLATLLPRPERTEARPGALTLQAPLRVAADDGAAAILALLFDLGRATGLWPERTEPSRAQLVLQSEPGDGEHYYLAIDAERAVLRGPPAGLVHGLYTLRQLLPAANWRAAPLSGETWVLPACLIEDRPRFSWRGLMIDTVRHFTPKQTLLRFIDLLAMHRMNRLHLHLSDDQGWRVEIKAFPRLTEVASWRPYTGLGFAGSPDDPHDGTPHGGYYSQDDLREIVAYAGLRNITVVPEIDLPGHARALIAAYPELGCKPERPVAVATYFGISRDLVSPLPPALRALEAILEEILAVFPSPYIHLGGDEAPLDAWRNSPAIQEHMAALGLASAERLRGHFTAHLADFLARHGRRLVGWDEVIHYGGLRQDSIVMSWRGHKGGIKAASSGHEVILAPVYPTYFDYAQDDSPDEPLAIGQSVTLEDVYTYDPASQWPDPERFGQVLGVQAQLWREVILDDAQLEYMAFPRLCALAEVAWSTQRQSVSAFRERLQRHLERLDHYGVNYRPLAGPRPWQKGGTGRKAYRPRFRLKDVLPYLDAWAESGEPPLGEVLE